jgi:hypothetical protein
LLHAGNHRLIPETRSGEIRKCKWRQLGHLF